jgi:putative acetyltransferase
MIRIRPERPKERDAVRAIHLAAFPGGLEAELVERLRRDGDAMLSLVAEAGGMLLGHALFSPVGLEPPVPQLQGAGLAPIAVLPRYQGRGIGTRLALAGIEACREAGLDYVVVLDEPAFYSRFGFRPAAQFGLSDTWIGQAAVQAIELKSGCLASVESIIRYAPAFEALNHAASLESARIC